MKITELLVNAVKARFELINSSPVEFSALLPIADAGVGDITWVRPGLKNIEELVNASEAGCLICNKETHAIGEKLGKNPIYVVSERPDLIFLEILKFLSKENSIARAGIHPTAIISEECIIGKNVSIGAYSIVDRAVIGDNCVIGNHVQIHDNVDIGNNCVIREFCSIGGAGFNFVKDEVNHLEHMPHIGKVIIEDDVHIFPFTNIDRATLTVTKIEKGVKIDHYCHIGHNSKIGANTIVTAQSVTCGGVTIGSGCFIGVNSLIRNNLTLGNNITTGIGAVVTKNIPDNETWIGNPAKQLNNK